MLKYVCFWKLSDDAGDEGDRLVRQYLDELPRRIGWVRSWTWGEALGTVGESFSYGFTAEFDHLEGLEGYLAHPDRLAIERRLAPYIADRLDAYYEMPSAK